jgi:predicted DNA-binding protein (MmcQ/YjbR family)
MEKETRHIFISLIVLQGRMGMGLLHLHKQLYTSYKLHEAKKPGKFFSKKSWVSHVASSSACWFHCTL